MLCSSKEQGHYSCAFGVFVALVFYIDWGFLCESHHDVSQVTRTRRGIERRKRNRLMFDAREGAES